MVFFFFSAGSVNVRDDCSFSWYWWNWWPSLLKFYFHNTIWRKNDNVYRCTLLCVETYFQITFHRNVHKANITGMVFVCTTVLYKYAEINYVYNLPNNIRVQSKIYKEFYHIVHIVNEESNIRMLNIQSFIYPPNIYHINDFLLCTSP